MSELTFILTCSNYNSGNPVTLAVSPDGWDQSMITWERSKKFWGVFRSWSIPLKFVKEGAEMLRKEFYTKGLAGIATLEIQRKNMITMVSTTAYTGAVDFTTFRDNEDAVDVNLLDSGVEKLIKENADTEYTIKPVNNGVWFFKDSGFNKNGCFLSDVAYSLLDAMTGGKVADGTYLFKSDLLDTYADGGAAEWKLVLSKGLSIRLSNPLTPPMRLTFSDFYQSIQFLNPCMCIEFDSTTGKQRIRIETKSYVFDSTSTIIDVGEAATMDCYPERDLTVGKIKTGWPAKEYTNALNYEEPNCTGNWITPVRESNNELDLVGKIRADGKGIDEIDGTALDTYDDDLFIVEVHKVGSDYIYEANGTGRLTATPATTWDLTNANLTQRTVLNNNLPYINSLIWNYSGGKIEFTAGDNELTEIEVDPDSGTYTEETADVTIGNPVYFLPIVFEIECALPRQIIDELNDNSIRRLQFTWKGNTYTGWVMEVKATLPGRSSAKIKLLACWGNFMTNLIR